MLFRSQAAHRLLLDPRPHGQDLTRIGMGRCQGRVCGTAAAEILAMRAGIEVEAVGRLRGQPPVKPIPLPWTDAT